MRHHSPGVWEKLKLNLTKADLSGDAVEASTASPTNATPARPSAVVVTTASATVQVLQSVARTSSRPRDEAARGQRRRPAHPRREGLHRGRHAQRSSGFAWPQRLPGLRPRTDGRRCALASRPTASPRLCAASSVALARSAAKAHRGRSSLSGTAACAAAPQRSVDGTEDGGPPKVVPGDPFWGRVSIGAELIHRHTSPPEAPVIPEAPDAQPSTRPPARASTPTLRARYPQDDIRICALDHGGYFAAALEAPTRPPRTRTPGEVDDPTSTPPSSGSPLMQSASRDDLNRAGRDRRSRRRAIPRLRGHRCRRRAVPRDRRPEGLTKLGGSACAV